MRVSLHKLVVSVIIISFSGATRFTEIVQSNWCCRGRLQESMCVCVCVCVCVYIFKYRCSRISLWHRWHHTVKIKNKKRSPGGPRQRARIDTLSPKSYDTEVQ
jgi:hypothetical protein